MNNFETGGVAEAVVENVQEELSVIHLRFFRHGDKESGGKGVGEDDKVIQLTERGRQQAIDGAQELKNPSLVKSFGSSRIRSAQTAVLKMVGNQGSVTAKTSTQDLNELTGKGLLGGSKLDIDDRLNFDLKDSTKGTGKVAYEAFTSGDYLRWLVEESDNEAVKNNDIENSSTYSKSAGNIASIVKDYIEGSDRWADIIKKDSQKDNTKYKPTLERFMGSHQGVTECFLAKVIERTQGIDRRDEFVKVLDGGFDFVEGFDVKIINEGGKKGVKISYEKKDDDGNVIFAFDEMVSAELIDEIVSEGVGVV